MSAGRSRLDAVMMRSVKPGEETPGGWSAGLRPGELIFLFTNLYVPLELRDARIHLETAHC